MELADVSQAISDIEKSWSEWEGPAWVRPCLDFLIADACVRRETVPEGLKYIKKGFAWSENGGLAYAESLLWSTKGDALLALDGTDEVSAERCYLKAIDVASSQFAKMWELRATTRLARLWHGQGRTAEARDLLAPVYGWFTEGHDTADLKEAKALLDKLC